MKRHGILLQAHEEPLGTLNYTELLRSEQHRIKYGERPDFALVIRREAVKSLE